MPTPSVAHPVKNRYPHNFVSPVNEWQLGYDARKARKPITVCVSDDMRDGWNAADDAIGRDCYIRAMQAEGVPFRTVCAVLAEA